MQILTALLAGLLFGVGLVYSGMTDPGKVQGFLDLAGRWDPSLAFVMVGAILVGFFAFRIARRRSVSLLGSTMQLPRSRDIDRRLVLGSVVFGLGWGLAGYCPGPALVSIGAGQAKAGLFVLAMIVGMLLYEMAERLMRRSGALAEASREA